MAFWSLYGTYRFLEILICPVAHLELACNLCSGPLRLGSECGSPIGLELIQKFLLQTVEERKC